MIIRMDFQDIGIVGIKTNYNEKEKTHYIRFVVDEYSIDRAIKVSRSNSKILALDYDGDYQYLFQISEKDRPKIPVIISKEFIEVNELAISFFMTSIPSWVRVAIRTSSDFNDMRLVELLSQKYPNICFCGGKFLRLPGCRVGCIQREDLPYKVSEAKIPYNTEGCACALLTMNEEDVEGKIFLFKESEIGTDLDIEVENSETLIVEKEEKKKLNTKKVKELLETNPKKARVGSIEDLFKF